MIEMRNERTGARRSVPHVGFSWTTLFLGPLVPLFRGDWKWALIMSIVMYMVGQVALFLAMLVSMAIVEPQSATGSFARATAAAVAAGIGLVVTLSVFATIYNRRYYADLVNDGFEEWSSS